jgi:hypothetical protein
MNKNILKEGYKEIDELSYLANMIIEELSKKHYTITNKIIENKPSVFYFIESKFYIYNDIIKNNESKFTIINDFIKNLSNNQNDIKILISHIINKDNGNYDSNNKTITIYNATKIIPAIKDYIKSNEINEPIPNSQQYKIFNLFAQDLLKPTLTHELQHAYDDFKSNGKYRTDKKSKNYYKNLMFSLNEPNENIYKDYLNLPHEYWARFSKYISKYPIFIKSRFVEQNFYTLLNSFKTSPIIQYNQIEEDSDKKRLIKALYKYWYLKHKT